MKLPNKLFSYEESTLSKLPLLLKAIINKRISVLELYQKHSEVFINTADFVEALDILFALGYIKLKEENGEVEYVEKHRV